MRTIASLSHDKLHNSQFVFHPGALTRAIDCFIRGFIGTCLYAVKTNPDTCILKYLYDNGITAFDVASLEEVKLVHNLFPDSTLFFMHPVKSRHAIREAYHTYKVRHFSLDSKTELQKIIEETDGARDLNLHVRLSIPNNFAELAMVGKFGINLQDAPDLIKEVAKYAYKTGICFHVGSQCMHPDAYRIAIRMATEVIETADIKPDFFNVGGGFPSIYPGMIPRAMQDYFDAIREEFKLLPNHDSIQLLAEPGRALVAESMSLIVRVDLKKGNTLYINEGTYGSLFDAGTPGFIFPMKLICEDKIYSSDLMPFSFYGPTCDSLDYMKGPFYLPNDIEEGDLIAIGQMGAYSRTLASSFNGFQSEKDMIHVSDEPLMTMYGNGHSANEKLEIIAA